jgi:uncharacterized protein
MIKKQTMKKIEKFAEQKSKGRDYNHAFDHIQRTVKLAKIIGKKEKADLDVVVVSAYLHDVGQSVRFKGHNKISVRMARELLKKLKFDKKFIEAVAHCIYCHSTSCVNEAKTIEAKVLYDADMLQTIGPFGFTRILTSKTVFKEFGRVGLKEGMQHTKDVEKKTKQHLQTKTGKRLAKDLFKSMKEFYERYEKWDKAKI